MLLQLRSLKNDTDELALFFASASALNRSDVTNDPRRFAADLRLRPNRQLAKMQKWKEKFPRKKRKVWVYIK